MGCGLGEGHRARNVLVSKAFSISIDSRWCRKRYFWGAQYKRYNLSLQNFPIVAFTREHLRWLCLLMILKRTRSGLPTLSSIETEASLVRDDFLVIFYLPLPPAMLARSPINSEHPPFIQDHHFPIAQSLPWNHESDLSKCYRPHPRQCYFSTCYSCICLILAKFKPFLSSFYHTSKIKRPWFIIFDGKEG